MNSETKKALLLISNNLNKSKAYATEFKKFNESQENLKKQNYLFTDIGIAVNFKLSETIDSDIFSDSDEGSFFVQHRDTEKATGMFATLVIVLPSNYSGGELVIRHGEQVVTLNMHRDEPSELTFAAFYADCVHEVQPITQGCRLTLIYNL